MSQTPLAPTCLSASHEDDRSAFVRAFSINYLLNLLVRMVPQQTRPTTISRHPAPVRLRVQSNVEPNGGKS